MTGNQSESTSPQRGDQPPAVPHPPQGPQAGSELVRTKELAEILAALKANSAASPAEAESARSARRSRLLIIIAAAGLVALGLARAPLFRPQTQGIPVPEELLGAWTTTSPRYIDRGFLITRDSLWLRLGPDQTTAYPILGVRPLGSDAAKQYVFRYRDGTSSLELGLRMNRDTTVHVANLPAVVWQKESR